MKRPPKPNQEPPAPKRYRVEFSPQAAKQFKKLPLKIAQQVKTEIAMLSDNPRPYGYLKLKGREGYRIRVGDYRVLYSIFDAVLLVEIVKVGTRGNFYNE
ncbi:type II toxin-antitoxin system RelE/ParE family toxin [uncultured Hymenobacter sp.]|uniref:type II toxin-antitoxin system RelE family toxin n=1 Tax=uncultured Hymenobacter sp. TaxID=170016 RepID=UPI0035C94F32